MTNHKDEIRALLAVYQQSLNTSDAGLATSCYAPDGTFMPAALPTSQGTEIEDAYRQIFEAIRLDVAFTIDELEVTSDQTAYALTRSNGTQTLLGTGEQTAESNREMFLLERIDTGWKIARYMFNTQP